MTGFIVQLLLALTLANVANCGRPLPKSDAILQLLQASESLTPLLSPVDGQIEASVYLQPPPARTAFEEERSRTQFTAERHNQAVRQSRTNHEAKVHRCCKSLTMNMLHKNPAGPNPIGNEFRPTKTFHRVKSSHYPPPFPN